MGILAGKTALITGATHGIGKIITIRFAREGINITFIDLVIDKEHGGKETERKLTALGIQMRGYTDNTADLENATALASQIKKDFGSIDILINSAGITKDSLALRMAKAQWDVVINVNLKDTFNFIHTCVPVMIRQRQDSIINIASVVSIHGNASQANYAASKADVIVLAGSVGQEMDPKGIRVNAIIPRFIDTAMTQTLPGKIHKERVGKAPLRCGGTVKDIANCALFLASNFSGYISGQVTQANEGMNMQSFQELAGSQIDELMSK